MKTNVTKIKRTQYLVAKRFQLKYVGQILLLMFFTAALCSYVIYYTSMLLLGEKLANVYPQGRLVSIVRIVNFRIFLSALLVSPLVALIGIFLSHRIAGPIARMERFLADMIAGDLSSRLILRQGDELLTLADGINSLSETIKSTILSQKSRLDKVSNELDDIKKLLDTRPQALSGITAGIDKLSDEVRDIKEEFDKYKL